jgi:hypothetical protein
MVSCVFLFLILPAVTGETTLAVTIHVPADQPTIQAGIMTANTGDTVLIAAGTYSGEGNRDLDPLGKQLTILGDGQVTIDGSGDTTDVHAAFLMLNGADSATILENLTITGCAADDGAIQVFLAEVTIRNCRITGNQTHGINSIGYAHPIVDSCLIYDNDGDGILVAGMVHPPSDLTARWCTIAGNAGHGIRLRSAWRVDATNCTMAMNQKGGFYLEGEPPKAAVDRNDDPTLVLTNCLLWKNGWFGVGQGQWYPDPDIICCNSYGNGIDPSDNFVFFPWFAGDTTGSISSNPLIVNQTPWPRFELRDDSPCLPANNGCGVLIGAWGAGTFVCECGTGATGDINLDGDRTLTDFTLLVNHLFVTFDPLECPPEGNTTGDAACDLNLTDLTALMKYFFVTFDPTADLSEFDNCLCY